MKAVVYMALVSLVFAFWLSKSKAFKKFRESLVENICSESYLFVSCEVHSTQFFNSNLFV